MSPKPAPTPAPETSSERTNLRRVTLPQPDALLHAHEIGKITGIARNRITLLLKGQGQIGKLEGTTVYLWQKALRVREIAERVDLIKRNDMVLPEVDIGKGTVTFAGVKCVHLILGCVTRLECAMST